MNAILDERIAPEMLLLFESAFVHTFKALNSLSKKPSCFNSSMSERRQQCGNWFRALSVSCSELPACTGQAPTLIVWNCHCAFVHDRAARARSTCQTANKDTIEEKGDDEFSARRMEKQLSKIDESLVECRRIQKLNELRSQTRVIKPATFHHKHKKSLESQCHRPKWFWNRWLVTKKYCVRDFKT
uniref:Uncharacterized protein n=1 Tax=Ditylenchus dipsaci TaxID=166011 RepID=A0A915DN74_9BILA